MTPEERKEQNQEIIGNLSANQKYFLVFQDTKKQLSQLNAYIQKFEPFVLVYSDNDDLNFNDLRVKYMIQFKKRFKHQKIKFEQIAFLELQSGQNLDKETIGSLKRKLNSENIDGLRIYCNKYGEEVAVLDSKNKKQPQVQEVSIAMEIQQLQYSGLIKIPQIMTGNFLKNKVLDIIFKQFKLKLYPDNIQVQVIYYDEFQQISDRLGPRDKIKVTIATQTKIEEKSEKLKKILTVAGENVETKKLFYDIVKDKKVSDLLRDQYQVKTIDWSTCGLWIEDQILKSHQNIQQCTNVASRIDKIEDAMSIVLKEYHLFEKEQAKIGEKKPIQLQDIISIRTSPEIIEKCYHLIEQIKQKMTIPHFKNSENVEPLVLYTSPIKVISSKKENKQTFFSLYSTVNEFLRTQNFSLTTSEDYQHWEYRYSHRLWKQFEHLPPCVDQILWRGVMHTPDHKEGERVLFKQFISSSLNRKAAENYAFRALFKIIKSRSGRKIHNFSYFGNEYEVLFPPYTQFEILKVSEIKDSQSGVTLKYFEMKQIQRDSFQKYIQKQLRQNQPFPENLFNIILWVDDKAEESFKYKNSFSYLKNTFIVLLFSTDELKRWLAKKVEQMKMKEYLQISMVSKMVRKQDDSLDEQAGIKGLDLFRQYFPKSRVCFIDSEGLANDKLLKYGCKESNNLIITTSSQNLEEFIKDESSPTKNTHL